MTAPPVAGFRRSQAVRRAVRRGAAATVPAALAWAAALMVVAAAASNASAAPPTAATVAPPAAPAAATTAPTPAATAPGAPSRARAGRAFRMALEAGLEHYRARRFAEARASFLRALADAPVGEARDNLEFNIATCDYALGDHRAAEQRFARLSEAGSPARGDALLHAGWSALARDDVAAAERYLEAVGPEAALAEKRDALGRSIEAQRTKRAVAAFEQALAQAAAAYDRGDLGRAEASIQAARRHEAHAPTRSRAALEYLAGLVAHDRGDDAAARAALERSRRQNPDDGAVLVMLGELALAEGDSEGAERHYQASLGADLSPDEARAVRQALDGLYPLPPPGLAAWLAVGAGYDSNATQSGSTDAVGFAPPEAHASPFAAPAWSVEYRWRSGRRTRVAPYYAGDWLLLGNPDVEDASLSSHEGGVRLHYAPSASAELRLAAGGGATLSGLELAPFSLDGVVRGRFALQHGRHFESGLAADARPSLGLSGRDYLTGTRFDLSLSERFDAGRWSAGASLGFRYNGIGTQLVGVDPARYPRCAALCAGARYVIPLGYAGPIAGVDAGVALGARLALAASARYEHRTYLDESRIDGPVLPEFIRSVSEKTRVDDRLTLGARARHRFGAAPELGVYLDYALRLSRSNVAYRRDLEHAFDYDDRNFTQHIVELGMDARY